MAKPELVLFQLWRTLSSIFFLVALSQERALSKIKLSLSIHLQMWESQ